MRYCTTLFLLLVAAMLTFGCAHAAGNPVTPTGDNLSVSGVTSSVDVDVHDPHMLWGQWTLYFNEDHTSVDVVPLRQARLHLNALKFLESYCADCLEITKIKNNGDSTIDMTVKITHPFAGHPEYTGFDVKGIIMFNGSYVYKFDGIEIPLPTPFFRISWKEMGDPEVLNPDGYSSRWTPNYDSGSDLPIFNYWEGKYAMGVPNGDLNAYLNYYSLEQRHIFYCDASLTRTYHIWLPQGPVVAGYAVEACWAPPTNVPVTDPLNDFPPEANQPEPYVFNYIINNNEPITEAPCCATEFQDCSRLRVECARWGGIITGLTGNTDVGILYPNGDYHGFGPLFQCSPKLTGSYFLYAGAMTNSPHCQENGLYRWVAEYGDPSTWPYSKYVFDIIDFEIQL